MHSIISNVVLPLFGVGIIVFCLLSFVFRYGKNIRGKTQKIKGFGVDMEVSVIALLIIIGVLLSIIGIYLQIRDFEAEIKKHEKKVVSANSAKEELKRALAQANKIHMNVLLTLDGVNPDQLPKLEEVVCEYYTIVGGEKKSVMAPVTKGGHNQFQITLTEVTKQTTITELSLKDLSTDRKWLYSDSKTFWPLVPVYTLEEEK